MDTTPLSVDEEEPHPKKLKSSPKKIKPIVIPRASLSKLKQSTEVSKKILPILPNTPSEILKPKVVVVRTPEILKTNASVSLQTPKSTTSAQPTLSDLLKLHHKTAPTINIQTSTAKTKSSPNSRQINISDKPVQWDNSLPTRNSKSKT